MDTGAALELEVPTNEAETLASQPHNFRPHLQLLKHQLQSLRWMESQEAGLHSSDRHWSVSGGVLADSIGTGKTCIGLALIDKARYVETPTPANILAARPNKLHSQATLVIVPP